MSDHQHTCNPPSSSTSAHPAVTSPDPTTTSPAVAATTQDAAQGGQSTTSASSAAQLAGLKADLRAAVKVWPDFPKPGILFEDIMPIFQDPVLFNKLLDACQLHITDTYGTDKPVDVIMGLEARGFLFGPALALRLGCSFVPFRKKGKLPGPTQTASYVKEYGEDFFEIQHGVIKPGQRVIVVDDLIATGGSASAAGSLVKWVRGTLLGYIFIIELDFLKGREKLEGNVFTLLHSQN